MAVMHFICKGTHVDIVEEFLYIETKKGNQLSDKSTVSCYNRGPR
jgi:hypothetical protein